MPFDEIEKTALRLCCSALGARMSSRGQGICPPSWGENPVSFRVNIGPSVCRSVAAAPALRMSTDGLISRRSFGSVAAAGLAALVVAKPSNAIEYSGTRNDGKWAVHEGAFKDEEFKGFITDPEVKAQWIPTLARRYFGGLPPYAPCAVPCPQCKRSYTILMSLYSERRPASSTRTSSSARASPPRCDPTLSREVVCLIDPHFSFLLLFELVLCASSRQARRCAYAYRAIL